MFSYIFYDLVYKCKLFLTLRDYKLIIFDDLFIFKTSLSIIFFGILVYFNLPCESLRVLADLIKEEEVKYEKDGSKIQTDSNLLCNKCCRLWRNKSTRQLKEPGSGSILSNRSAKHDLQLWGTNVLLSLFRILHSQEHLPDMCFRWFQLDDCQRHHPREGVLYYCYPLPSASLFLSLSSCPHPKNYTRIIFIYVYFINYKLSNWIKRVKVKRLNWKVSHSWKIIV